MKSLTRYTKKRLKRITRLLNSFPESPDLEVLHDLRLEIKKIKTLLHLIHYNKKQFKEHSAFIPFRSIFRDCEKIREPQVLYNLVMKFTEYRDLPAPDSSMHIQQFTKEIPAHLKKVKKQSQVILTEIVEVKTSIYARYLKKKVKELRSLSSAISVKDFHSYRKLIKEIYYLLCIKTKKGLLIPFSKKLTS